MSRIVEVRQRALKENDLLARDLRRRFHEADMYVVSVVSSPGSGKTAFLEKVRTVIHDTSVDVRWARDRYRPAGASPLTTDAFRVLEAQVKKHYGTVVLPTMGIAASDMAQIRSKGVQCYGIGSAVDREDSALGFGAHSDQERSLESELHRFVRFQREVVVELARGR